jgi:hypothetical protein
VEEPEIVPEHFEKLEEGEIAEAEETPGANVIKHF